MIHLMVLPGWTLAGYKIDSGRGSVSFTHYRFRAATVGSDLPVVFSILLDTG